MNRSSKMNTVTVMAVMGLGSIIFSGCQPARVLGPREIIPAYKDEVITPVVETPRLVLSPGLTDSTSTPKFEDITPKPMEPRKWSNKGLHATKKTVNPPRNNSKAIEYTVKKNDSLWKIARSHGTGYITLAKYNNMSMKTVLRPGQKIMIPSSSEAKAMIGKKLTTTKVKHGKVTTKKYQAIPKSGTYTVKSGDSLWKIARRFGVKISDLAAANNIEKNAMLKLGQKLTIPGKSVNSTQTKTTTLTPQKTSQVKEDLPSTTTPIDDNDDMGLDIGELPDSGDNSDSDGDVFFAEKDMTIEDLSKKYGVSVEQLLKLNDNLRKFKKDDMYYLPKK